MLRVLDRYMIKDLAPPFALVVCVLTFFLVIDRVYQLTDLVITKSVPVHFVLGLLVFMLPGVLALTVPMALLVSALLTIPISKDLVTPNGFCWKGQGLN